MCRHVRKKYVRSMRFHIDVLMGDKLAQIYNMRTLDCKPHNLSIAQQCSWHVSCHKTELISIFIYASIVSYILCIKVSPWASLFVVQAHEECMHVGMMCVTALDIQDSLHNRMTNWNEIAYASALWDRADPCHCAAMFTIATLNAAARDSAKANEYSFLSCLWQIAILHQFSEACKLAIN